MLVRAFTLALLFAFPFSAHSSEPIPAPAFALPAIQNYDGTLSLESLRGKVVYLDFWASWCGPCRISLPALNALQLELGQDKFQVIAVSVDVVEEDALDFLERYKVEYPVVIDTEGDVPKSYAVEGMPSGYLIDQSGMVRSVHVGFKRGDEAKIKVEVEALIQE